MNRNPLNTKELRSLRAALEEKSSNPDGGYLREKPYAVMAVEFGERIGKKLSARQIRYYVGQLKDPESVNALKYQHPRGAPKAIHRAKQAQRLDFTAALYAELLVLTGKSPSALYKALSESQDKGLNLELPMGKSTLHSWLTHPSFSGLPPTIKAPRKHIVDRNGPLKKCRLHIHAAHFELDPGKRYLLVLGGFEEETGYTDFRFIEARVNNESAKATDKKRGRPIKCMDGFELAVSVTSEKPILDIPPEMLASFIDDMIDPLRVPVTRIQLRNSVFVVGGLEALQALMSEKKISISQDEHPWHDYLPHHLPPTVTPQHCADVLKTWVKQYNTVVATSVVVKTREDFNADLTRAQAIPLGFGRRFTREEQRLLDLKNFGLKATTAQTIFSTPCMYLHVNATIKESGEPKPDTHSQAS